MELGTIVRTVTGIEGKLVALTDNIASIESPADGDDHGWTVIYNVDKDQVIVDTPPQPQPEPEVVVDEADLL